MTSPLHFPQPSPESRIAERAKLASAAPVLHEEDSSDERFESLRDSGRDLLAAGDYSQASVAYRRAADLAGRNGENDRRDEALCGWAAAETELGSGPVVMPELRRILLRSAVEDTCWLAAYTLARAHELDGETKKALFYARLSRHHSELGSREGTIGLSHNLLGNLLVAEGNNQQAADEYRLALRHTRGATAAWSAGAEGNLGYCLLMNATSTRRLRGARMREGLRLIYRSLRTFRREGAEHLTMLPHLDLCLAHLEMGRFASAKRHGQRALALADRQADAATMKNCLYLLGQVAVEAGDSDEARSMFGELEQRFYPERNDLPEVLMALDLRQVVNLRA